MYEKPYPTRRRRRTRRYRRKSVIPVLILMGALLAGGMLVFADSPDEDDIIHFQPYPSAGSTAPKDTVAPRIYGVQDLILYEGDTASYLSGIWAADDCDPAPTVTVDSSCVDLSKAGSYDVVYTATDSAGNSASTRAVVTVLEKRDGFVDLAIIYAAADAKLEELLSEGTSTKEQVSAIYSWARTCLSYGGHSDRTDWRQTAYTMLTEGRGDCFGYFAVTKLLLERLEIPNIDVRKVKNSEDDSDHFWSLVSVDGGESYYHFDATPRVGDGDDFCLVTDAFLDAYSASHKNSHNRDTSLYPATPEEAL